MHLFDCCLESNVNTVFSRQQPNKFTILTFQDLRSSLSIYSVLSIFKP